LKIIYWWIDHSLFVCLSVLVTSGSTVSWAESRRPTSGRRSARFRPTSKCPRDRWRASTASSPADRTPTSTGSATAQR